MNKETLLAWCAERADHARAAARFARASDEIGQADVHDGEAKAYEAMIARLEHRRTP